MRISRRSLRAALRQQARIETPPPSDSFVDSLEQRLRSLDLAPAPASSNVRQLRRGLSRGAAIGVVAALASGAAAAAVAIVNSRHDDPAPVVTAPTDAPTTTTPASSTTASPTSVVGTTLPATTVSTMPPSTIVPATLPVDAATTVPPATEAATTAPPPPTELPTTAAPPITAVETTLPPPPATAPPEVATTSSTEVHVPATMGLECAVDATSITCSWTPGPDGTDHYVILRSSPSEARGRVLNPDPGATTFVDIGVVPGNTYTYLVHALDAGEHSLAHSTPVTLPCCG